jgi:hypothetical protein
MTIHGLGYRPFHYQPVARLLRLVPIFAAEFRTLFRTRWGVALWFFCLLPVLVSLVALLIRMRVLSFGADQMPQRFERRIEQAHQLVPRMDPFRLEFYVEPATAMGPALALTLLLTTLVTARAIAKDRAVNALELYWTRGIGPRGYFFAKWGGSLLLLGCNVVLAPFLLFVLGSLLHDDWEFLQKTGAFVPRALLGNAVFAVLLTLPCICLSAIAGSPNLASILWCLLVGGTSVIADRLGAMARDQGLVAAAGTWNAAETVARSIAGLPLRGLSLPLAIVHLAVLDLLLAGLAWRRLRLQEAIG